MASVSDTTGAGGRLRRLAVSPRIWAWGLLCGVLIWALGFWVLPWWAALLLWWWPSLLFGAALSLATIALTQTLGRRGRVRRGP